MTDVDSTTLIPNPYKAALEAAAAQARPIAAKCASALDDVVSAMNGGAWSGTSASDTFFAALKEQDKAAEQAGQDAVDELERAAAREDAKVAPGSWQTHWRNLLGF